MSLFVKPWRVFSHHQSSQGSRPHLDLVPFCFPLAEIREAFRVLDRDGNGFISKQELGMAMRSLGYMPSEVELAIIMQRLDMDGETWAGSISRGGWGGGQEMQNEPGLISALLGFRGLALGVERLGVRVLTSGNLN